MTTAQSLETAFAEGRTILQVSSSNYADDEVLGIVLYNALSEENWERMDNQEPTPKSNGGRVYTFVGLSLGEYHALLGQLKDNFQHKPVRTSIKPAEACPSYGKVLITLSV